MASIVSVNQLGRLIPIRRKLRAAAIVLATAAPLATPLAPPPVVVRRTPPVTRPAPRPIVRRTLPLVNWRASGGSVVRAAATPRPRRASPRPIVVSGHPAELPQKAEGRTATEPVRIAPPRPRAARAIVLGTELEYPRRPASPRPAIVVRAARPRAPAALPILRRNRGVGAQVPPIRVTAGKAPQARPGAPAARLARTPYVTIAAALTRPCLVVARIPRPRGRIAPQPILTRPVRPAVLTRAGPFVVHPPGARPRPGLTIALFSARWSWRPPDRPRLALVVPVGRRAKARPAILRQTLWRAEHVAFPRPVVVPPGRKPRPPAAAVLVRWTQGPGQQVGPPHVLLTFAKRPRAQAPPALLRQTRATPVVVMTGHTVPVLVRPGRWPSRASLARIVQSPTVGHGMPSDLLAAAIQWLRGQPAILAAFGDGGIGGQPQKLWSDYAAPSYIDSAGNVQKLNPPYATFHEIGEPFQAESPQEDGTQVLVGQGQFQVSIFAATRVQARQLGNLILSRAAGLYNAPLTFTDGTLLDLRPANQFFVPVPQSGVQAQAAMFHRILVFHFIVDREV